MPPTLPLRLAGVNRARLSASEAWQFYTCPLVAIVVDHVDCERATIELGVEWKIQTNKKVCV